MLALNYKKSIKISPKNPYNFDATIYKPSHYPTPLEVYEKGKYWFVLRLDSKIFGIKLEDLGTIRKPSIKVTIYSNRQIDEAEINEILDELSFRYEFDKDISIFYEKFRNDKILSHFLKRWRGMHGSCNHSLYELLMIGIFLQNATVRRSIQMTKNMLEKYGAKVKFDNKTVYTFWTPEEMSKTSEEKLRLLKVGYRAKIFIKLSQAFVEQIDENKLRQMPAKDLKKKLMNLYGVGKETARILLFEAFHRYDTFEHVAPWQQKILSRLIFNKELVPSEEIINYVNKRWSDWSALAVHYIWEDIFWQRHKGKSIEWLEKEIRL